MFVVKKKPLTPNIIWDAEQGKQLCKFVKGELKTDDIKLVEKLKEMGCEVSGEENTSAKTNSDNADDDNADHEEPDDGKSGEEDTLAKAVKSRKAAKN